MKRISDYPPHFQNFKRDSIGSISFSDTICSGVTGLKMDRLFTPVGGLVMSGEHYLKINNSDQFHQDFPLGYFLKSI